MADVFRNGAPARVPASASPVKGPTGRGRRAGGRKGAADSVATLSAITDLLTKNAEGLRAEQIRNTLGVDKPTVTKALTAGLEAKKGEKRATEYFVR